MPGIITALVASTALGMWMVLRHNDTQHAHRSFLQWVILMLFRMARFCYAVATGFDYGYLQYRKALEEAKLELENENALGKVLKQVPQKNPGCPKQPTTLPWPSVLPPPPPGGIRREH